MSSNKSEYNNTLFLPKTSFSMRASLPTREKEMISFWNDLELWTKLREQSKNKKKFILHDGPPYANGAIHIGTATNKILKDIINRTMQMEGFNSYYIPGWDCHGLPIEWQIEQKYRKKGINKDQVNIKEFRKECRDFAKNWVKVQMESFKRLFVLGDWEHPYLTMKYEAEATIVEELGKFLLNGSLYRGAKPVMWSPIEKTALAEAEIEYKDIETKAIYVMFRVANSNIKEMDETYAIIWTTTPWTIPANKAIAYHKDIDYVIYNITECENDKLKNKNILLAKEQANTVFEKCKILSFKEVRSLKGYELEGISSNHPLVNKGYEYVVPFLHADFVKLGQGTGLVHIAPAHGEDDFELGKKENLPVIDVISDNGTYIDELPIFSGIHVFKADSKVIDELNKSNTLLGLEEYVHSYPHSWRSKKPVIYRSTPQWFIEMNKSNLRKTAIQEIDNTNWIPNISKNRIKSMLESRPDWCVSRQRSWGVPITVFVNKKTGEPLRDELVLKKIVAAVKEKGSDIWLSEDPYQYLGDERKKEDYEVVTDILDVWFDSGSTHAFVLENNDSQSWPADLYIEGTDQHRGWFQSSLLEACGTRGKAPFKNVLTHGFVLDGNGRKMSKSAGNVVSPEEIIKNSGADVLRLWVALTDCSEDMRISDEIISNLNDHYRRLRNTLRFVLGNIGDYSDSEDITYNEMLELDKWVLARLVELSETRKKAIKSFTFHHFYRELIEFCSSDLSAFYFDINKDILYCDSIKSKRRRSCRTVLNILHDYLTSWLAPVLCFTMEEAWQIYKTDKSIQSVHLKNSPTPDTDWNNEELIKKWEIIRRIRKTTNGVIEKARADKEIGSSLETTVSIYVEDENARNILKSVSMNEISIVSDFIILEEKPTEKSLYKSYEDDGKEEKTILISVKKSKNKKCMRCWKFLHEVGMEENKELCNRCFQTISE